MSGGGFNHHNTDDGVWWHHCGQHVTDDYPHIDGRCQNACTAGGIVEPQDESVDWHAAAARSQRHNLTIVHDAGGGVVLSDGEHRFVRDVCWGGGFEQVASLLRKVRGVA